MLGKFWGPCKNIFQSRPLLISHQGVSKSGSHRVGHGGEDSRHGMDIARVILRQGTADGSGAIVESSSKAEEPGFEVVDIELNHSTITGQAGVGNVGAWDVGSLSLMEHLSQK